jgi:tetratricopeptide (TPR) repeat protein
MEMGGSVLAQAHEIMTEVYEQQKLQQGKEHIMTLLALDLLARIKSKMGYSEEAEEMMSKGLRVAMRNLGEDNLGVLAAWTHYSEILIRLNKLDEAEVHLRRVSQQRRYAHAARNDGEHLDRIVALRALTECLKQQGRYDAALVECIEMESALLQIGGEGLGLKHPIYVRVKAKRKELEALCDNGTVMKASLSSWLTVARQEE